MKKIAKITGFSALTVLAVVATAFSFSVALAKSEVADCYELQSQAEEFRGNGVFYITGLEDKMCRAHDILINAPVK